MPTCMFTYLLSHALVYPAHTTASTAKQTATGVEDSTEDENNGADEEDTGAPHKISYTVAGMPRVVDGDASDFDRRGPREGTVTAFAGWTLRDLKVE